jgi:hypothetical protein
VTDLDTLTVIRGQLARLNEAVGCSIMSKSDEPLRVLVSIVQLGEDTSTTEWISLGDVVEIQDQPWRFEDIAYGNTSDQWWITLRRVAPNSPPFVPPPMTGQRVWQRVDMTTYGPVSEEQLASLERDLGRDLPHEYRRWLADTNGATFAEEVTILGTPFTLFPGQALLGVHPETPHWDLRFGDRRRALWLDERFLVIAIATNGLIVTGLTPMFSTNVFLLTDLACQSVSGYQRAGYQDRTDYLSSKLIHLAPDMWSFCDYLQPAPELPPLPGLSNLSNLDYDGDPVDESR